MTIIGRTKRQSLWNEKFKDLIKMKINEKNLQRIVSSSDGIMELF